MSDSYLETNGAREILPPLDTTPPQLVNGYDAAFWAESYRMLRDAVLEHLGRFVHDDDVAEEAIIVDAIERAGKWANDG